MKRTELVLSLVLGALLLALTPLHADRTLYVSTNGTHNSPFTNGWTSAATNIHSAVALATNGDMVLVSNGVFYLTNQLVILQPIVFTSLYGREQTVIHANNYAGKPVTNRCLYVNANAMVDGFTIANGVFVSADYTSLGAGAYLGAGTLRNCRIAGNSAPDTYGSGVYVGNATMQNCEIYANSGCYGTVRLDSGANVTGCIVSNNIVNHHGGGLYFYSGSATASYCRIVGNQATQQGGGAWGGGVMQNCFVLNNTANDSGAGLYKVATVRNCTISGNVKNGMWYGGGVFVSGDCMYENCVISSNWSNQAGGGVATDGASGTSIFQDCLIVANAGTAGGGVYGNATGTKVASFRNCTIVSNLELYSSAGAGVRMDSPPTYFVNCIIYSNRLASGSFLDVYSKPGSNNSNALSYCCTSATNGFIGQGNRTNNPQFVDFPVGNFHLVNSSPCIDAGTNEVWMAMAKDLDGYLRLRGNAVDMGVYEYFPKGTIFWIQ